MRARAVLLALAGCAPGAHHASGSTTLALADGLLWVASPDDDLVVGLDPDSLEERQRLEVPGGPHHLLVVGDDLVVSLAREAAVAFVRGDRVARVEVPCGGTAGLAAEADDSVWVACPHDGRVVRLVDGAVDGALAVGGRPTGLAVADATLWIADAGRGALGRLDLDLTRPGDPWDPPGAEPDLQRPEVGGLGVSGLQTLTLDGRGQPLAVFSAVDHDGDRSRPAAQGGYGDVVDGAPRIEPRVAGACASRYARFDGGPLVLSGPSALAWDEAHQRLWVAHRGTRNVAVLDCASPGDRAPVLAVARVGGGARGILLSRDGQTAWVDDGFDRAVSRVRWAEAGGAPRALPVTSLLRAPGPSALSEAARRGRAVFHDALDIQLTPSGIVSCATCHPEGGDDGLAWFLHTPTVERKLRRTPPAWAVDPTTRPLHWDGAFDDAAALVRATIEGLMGGEGLLVDADAVAAFMRELPPPPPRPVAPGDEARVARGEAVFGTAGCAACHQGPSGSDGLRHAVLAPSPDPDAALPQAVTPTLLAVRARAPYLHDGRAPTLRAVLTEHNPDDAHGRTSGLPQADLDALLAYLESR